MILTARECEVLRRLAGGASYQDIADVLCVSLATAKTHILHISQKLHARNGTHAVIVAVADGLLSLREVIASADEGRC